MQHSQAVPPDFRPVGSTRDRSAPRLAVERRLHRAARTSAWRSLAVPRGGAEGGQIAAKMANQFDKSAFLRKTYAPVDLQAVRAADEARRRGRKRGTKLE